MALLLLTTRDGGIYAADLLPQRAVGEPCDFGQLVQVVAPEPARTTGRDGEQPVGQHGPQGTAYVDERRADVLHPHSPMPEGSE